jgi:hypothetical protein
MVVIIMVQFLILTVFFLFAGVELWQWLKGVVLPLPFYLMGGAFLAIASNYQKGLGELVQKRPAPRYQEVLSEPNQMVLPDSAQTPSGKTERTAG